MNTKYFGIAIVGNIKELGRAPRQVFHRFNNNGMQVEEFSHEKYPNENAGFNFQLNRNAKASDFISVTGYAISALLVKEHVYMLLTKFNLYPLRVYDAVVIEHNGVKHQYKWIHFILSDVNDVVDFKKSSFAKYINPFDQFQKIESVQIESLEQYETLYKIDSRIGIETIYFTTEFRMKKYDLFFIPLRVHIFHSLIVTRDLAIALQQAKFTSIRLKDLPNWQ